MKYVAAIHTAGMAGNESIVHKVSNYFPAALGHIVGWAILKEGETQRVMVKSVQMVCVWPTPELLGFFPLLVWGLHRDGIAELHRAFESCIKVILGNKARLILGS